MKLVKIRITGTSQVLLSCDKLADPLDQETIAHKKLTSIRGKSKTQDVIVAIEKSQYVNGLYYSKETGVFIPSINVKKCLNEHPDEAMTRLKTRVRKETIRAMESLSLINEELLSDDASKKMDSGIAKIAALAAFSKTRLKG